MDLFERLEKGLEGVIERITDGVFRTSLQPVEIGKKLTREMDSHRTVAPSSTFVPNLYLIQISPDNFAKFHMLGAALLNEFEILLKQHATEQDYKTIGRIAVRLQQDESLKSHEAKILAIDMKNPPSVSVVIEKDAAGQPIFPAVPEEEAPSPEFLPVNEPVVPVNQPPALSWQTEVLRPAVSPAIQFQPEFMMEVVDGPERGHSFTLRTGLRIGRGSNNDIPLTDNAVSREHAEVLFQDGAWIVRDLGSANHIYVNGAMTQAAILNPGDEVTIGRTKLVMRMV